MFSAATKSARVATAATYIEDVFSTYLYTGNGSTQTITNGIDLSTYGGLVWIKDRSAAIDNALFDTARGVGSGPLISNSTLQAGWGAATTLTAFNTNGFDVSYPGSGSFIGATNRSPDNYASWTFRKQPKFFDVVTFNQNGGVTVNHNLGSVPACIIIKSTSVADNWYVYHTSLNAPNGNGPRYNYLTLNSTASATNAGGIWINNITSTSFDITNQVVAPFQTYVAYIFASNAGGFGLTGTDNVISCGSFTVNGSGDCSVSLGYEPQWLMVKSSTAIDNWYLYDNMRGFPVAPSDGELLRPNTSQAGITGSTFRPTSTGFVGSPGTLFGTGIYIAIRRGPMKTPTSGTSVYYAQTYTGSGAAKTLTGSSFSPDLVITKNKSDAGYGWPWIDRLRGIVANVWSSSTAQEFTNNTDGITSLNMDGISLGANVTGNAAYELNQNTKSYVDYWLRRAPGFFDEVCYTGNNVYQQAQTHNLGVAPELIIVKRRDSTANWAVGCNFTNTEFQYLNLNSGADGGNTNAYTTGGFFGGKPTATTFILAQNATTNASGGTYVAYLFATLAGVSKVGTYTGTGAAQTINCGFTGGARFVLIKRLGDNVDPGIGDWYVYDSARGITSGNDPYLFLNSTAAEVTSTNYVDTDTTGFKVTAAAPAGLNASGGTFVFLAVA